MSAHTPPLPPGPRMPAALQFLAFAADPAKMTERWRRRYGSAVGLRWPGTLGTVLWLGEPEAVKTIFTESQDGRLSAGQNFGVFAEFLGPHSLFTLDGPEHMRQRKLLLPSFTGDRVKAYYEIMREATLAELARWPRDKPFAVRPGMQRMTLEVILHAVFGVPDPARRVQYAKHIHRNLSLANVYFVPPRLRRLGVDRLLARRRAQLDALIYEDIAIHRASGGGGTDVLSTLMEARDEDGEAMSDTELRDELVTLLLAGHETTATGLSWALDLLVHHPAEMERAVAAARDDDRDYLDAVVKEVLRVRPVVYAAGRIVTEPLDVEGYHLPEGARVWAPIGLLARDGRFFDDPHAFRPARFLEDGDDPPSYTYIPFGGGIRRCIGAAFAGQQMRIALQTLLTHARFEPARDACERSKLDHATVVPARGAEVIVRGL